MNEELKIIISAVTGDANKKLQGVKKELGGLSKAGDAAGMALGALKTAATVAIGAVVAVGAAVVGVGAALSKVSESTAEYRKSMAQLTTAFEANGSSAEQAKKTYGELYRFLGETDTAVEASNLLAQLTTDEKELAQWTTALQGVYATFPDSLPIESLVEASNETAKVGKVTGTLADALNWAGVSEDAFNAKLEATSSIEEREALIRQTLNGLYSDAAALYEKNAAGILAQNEAQTRLAETTARIGAAAQPLQTAFTNLSASLLEALAPAIEAVVPYLVKFINAISAAVSWVTTLIGALTGSGKAAAATQKIATAANSVGSGFKTGASGAKALSGGLGSAVKNAEKLKKVTASFDELNIISNPTTSASTGSSGGGTGGGSIGGGGGSFPSGGAILPDLGLTDSFDKSSASAEKFAEKIKSVFEKIKGVFIEFKEKVVEWATLFEPSFTAWKTAFEGLKEPASTTFTSMGETFNGFVENTLKPYYAYWLEDFIPTIVNSISENLAPAFSDVLGFAITEAGKDFEWYTGMISAGANDILIPTLELVKTMTTDTLDAVGEEWNKSGEGLLTKLGEVRDGMKEIWENLYYNILKPVWDEIITALSSIWKEHLEPLWKELLSFFSKLTNCVMTLWNNVLAPIVNWIFTVLAPIVVNAVKSIMSVVNTVTGIVSGVTKGVLKALGGLLDFLTGVFSGNWRLMWNGIKTFFKGIWDSIWAICKGVVNLIIDGINGLWSGIYSTIQGLINGIGSIAGAIGDLLGQDWSFSMPAKAPRIPKLATGGIVNSATMALIGESGKEAVLPLENNTGWMDMLADKIAARNSAPSKIVLQLDGKELGWANINSINNITAQTGSLQLVLA